MSVGEAMTSRAPRLAVEWLISGRCTRSNRGQSWSGARLFAALALVATALASWRPAHAEPTARGEPTITRIGAFVASLSDISESQRRFDVTLWVWLVAPAGVGPAEPGRTLEITNAASFERVHAVTTERAGARYTQVKLRAWVRNPLDFADFPFDNHTLEIHIEDAERDVRSLELVPDTPQDGSAALTISNDLDPQDWTIGRLALTTVHHREATNFGEPGSGPDSEYARAVLGIDIARKHSLRILLTLLLGTFLGTIVAFFAVLLPIQHAPPRYTLLSGAIFVCVANRLLVDSRLPPGSSLGLLDQLQLVAIGGLVVLTAGSLWLTNLADGRIPTARATQLSQRGGVAWLVVLTAIEAALVLTRA